MAITTREDMPTISEIAERALQLPWPGEAPTKLDIMMDLSAVHEKCPMNFSGLALSNSFDFAHDIGGIRRHLNRETFELEDCFIPRYARR